MLSGEEIMDNLESKYLKETHQNSEVIYSDNKEFQMACENARAAEYALSINYYHQWEDLAEQKEKEEREASLCRIGLPMLDSKIKIFGKRLVMIIGRSEYGKTSFAAQMMRTQIMDDKRILFFSCEEAGEDFISRLNFIPEVQEKLYTNFVMTDKGNISLEDIKLTCLKLDLIGVNPDIVYIDQLNKIKPDVNFKGSKHERIVHVSEQLQNLVKIINRPLVILHQANRAAEQNDGFMTQANVSDADAIFNEAQIALFLESKEYFEWNKTKSPYQDIFKYFINVGKNRSKGGWKGAEACYFDRSKGIFLSESEYYESKSVLDYRNAKGSF